MSASLNPAASHALPIFVVGPGETDTLLIIVGLFLLVALLLAGVFFLWLHSLPERMAHAGHKLQLEVVAVLCLLALFTHNNALWVAALLLALIDLPDVLTPLNRLAGAMDAFVTSRAPAPTAPPADENPPLSADTAIDAILGKTGT